MCRFAFVLVHLMHNELIENIRFIQPSMENRLLRTPKTFLVPILHILDTWRSCNILDSWRSCNILDSWRCCDILDHLRLFNVFYVLRLLIHVLRLLIHILHRGLCVSLDPWGSRDKPLGRRFFIATIRIQLVHRDNTLRHNITHSEEIARSTNHAGLLNVFHDWSRGHARLLYVFHHRSSIFYCGSGRNIFYCWSRRRILHHGLLIDVFRLRHRYIFDCGSHLW
mmetsp:Transcript_116969/g.183990  ORF Transcript_116969/g.183990 Transcript_116969/m.183990 type:complete len:224 (-) Transcript_116969:33-704(-)